VKDGEVLRQQTLPYVMPGGMWLISFVCYNSNQQTYLFSRKRSAMSEQEEPTPVEPVELPEEQEPVESTVDSIMACQINVEQNAAIHDSLAGAIVAGQNASADNSVSAVLVAGGNAQFGNSAGAVAVVGGTAEISNSTTGLLFAPGSAVVEHSTIGVLFAPQAVLKDNVTVIMTIKQALLFGAAFGLAAAVFGRLLRRR
jgi:hypothetical protein